MTRSSELQPGTRVQHSSGAVVTLDRRKTPDEDHHGLPYHSGWWVREGGGLADLVLDDPDGDWSILEDAAA